MEAEDAFTLLLFIGLLLVFYPLTFGIQSDKDARTLEIIFGIPNYRYRVWLVRMFMIFIRIFLVSVGSLILLIKTVYFLMPIEYDF